MALTAPNYTQLPHEVIDTHMPDLTNPELRVLLVIARFTKGFQRDSTTMSIAALAKSAGVSKSSVCEATESLESKGLIIKVSQKATDGANSANRFELNCKPIPSPESGEGSPNPGLPLSNPRTTLIQNLDKHKEERNKTEENKTADEEQSSSEQLRAVVDDIEEGFSSTSSTSSWDHYAARRVLDTILRPGMRPKERKALEAQQWIPELPANELLQWAIRRGVVQPRHQESAPQSGNRQSVAIRSERNNLRDVEVVRVGPSDPDEWIEWCRVEHDAKYALLCSLWPAGGAEYSVHSFRDGLPEWDAMPMEHRDKTLAYAAWKFQNTEPQFFPSSIKRLFAQKPWDKKIQQRTLPDPRGKPVTQSDDEEKQDRLRMMREIIAKREGKK